MTANLIDLLDGPVEVVGALDLDRTGSGVVPRRLPAWTRPQIPDLVMSFVVQSPSGVRLRFRTDSTTIALDVHLTMLQYEPGPFRGSAFDLTVDNSLVATVPTSVGTRVVLHRDAPDDVRIEPGEPTSIRFDGLDPADKVVELWLPHNARVELRDLRVDAGASIAPAPDDRPTWLHYGSSISHCLEADSPTGTWPAVAAALADVRLINLGFAGQCLLDGFVARTIRDLDVDVISLKVGINVVNADAFRERTFVPAVQSFLDTIRDGHPTTPVLLASPILCPPVEDHPGPTVVAPTGKVMAMPALEGWPVPSLTLMRIRGLIGVVVEERRKLGDEHLHYLDGRWLLGPDDVDDLPDDLHPNADGYRRMGQRFADHAFGEGGPLAPVHR